MTRPVGRDERQVRDAEHLPETRERAKRPADLLANGAADSLIDLVEDQERHPVPLRHQGLDGEHHSGKLSSRRDPLQRARRLSRIGSELE